MPTSWGWARPESGANNTLGLPPTRVAEASYPSSNLLSPKVHAGKKLQAGSELGPKPRHSTRQNRFRAVRGNVTGKAPGPLLPTVTREAPAWHELKGQCQGQSTGWVQRGSMLAVTWDTDIPRQNPSSSPARSTSTWFPVKAPREAVADGRRLGRASHRESKQRCLLPGCRLSVSE